MAKALIIIFCGAVLQLSAVWFLGQSRDGGLFFCCRGVPDDIYHLALTNQLVTNFPPQEPGMTGVIVKNYHYLASLVMADFIRVFNLPLTPTVYQYFPALISVLLGLTIIVIAQLLSLNNKITHWWLFFLYFHGDILYSLLWLRGRGLNLDVTIFDDATKLLAGPPRSFSILLLFTGIALFSLWVKRKSLLLGILVGIVLGSLIGFKVYTGIFALIGMAAIGIYYLLKREWKMLSAPLITLVASLAIYLPVNGTTGGLIFNGSYRFDNFISHQAFGLTNLFLWKEAGWWPLEFLFFGAYLVFLYGPSLLAVFQTRTTLKPLSKEINLFFLSASVVTGVIGLFFLQNIGGLNTVQFLIALYFIFSLYAALVVSRLPNSHWSLIIGTLIIIFTVPRPLYETWGNVQMIINRQRLFISQQELEGLNYLKQNTPKNAVVGLPKDFARQEISLYVSFLTNHSLYLAGYTGVLQDHEVIGAKERLENPDFSKIDYFFWPKKYPASFRGQTVFENQEVKIIKNPKTVK